MTTQVFLRKNSRILGKNSRNFSKNSIYRKINSPMFPYIVRNDKPDILILLQVHGLARDDIIYGDAWFPARGHQERRRDILQGFQDNQDQVTSGRSLQTLHLIQPRHCGTFYHDAMSQDLIYLLVAEKVLKRYSHSCCRNSIWTDFWPSKMPSRSQLSSRVTR